MAHCRSTRGANTLLALFLVAACTEAPPADAPAEDGATQLDAEVAVEPAAEANVFHPGDALPWGEPNNGMRYLALYGQSSAGGAPFVFRLEVQPGFELAPHTHPITEHMTVLSGNFFVGIGETFDREAATAYGPGSYLAIAAGVPAYMWVEEETVVQVHGVGPLTTDFITPPEG
ncbi:MAG: hypothetical protein F4Y07_11505 [Gemmatimonadetes bacterium]|nr:hypothetical protein [Gemmatimonadota bacterium]MYE17094.1 hypothetical protein [Gemmatimonadota bacterium]